MNHVMKVVLFCAAILINISAYAVEADKNGGDVEHSSTFERCITETVGDNDHNKSISIAEILKCSSGDAAPDIFIEGVSLLFPKTVGLFFPIASGGDIVKPQLAVPFVFGKIIIPKLNEFISKFGITSPWESYLKHDSLYFQDTVIYKHANDPNSFINSLFTLEDFIKIFYDIAFYLSSAMFSYILFRRGVSIAYDAKGAIDIAKKTAMQTPVAFVCLAMIAPQEGSLPIAGQAMVAALIVGGFIASSIAIIITPFFAQMASSVDVHSPKSLIYNSDVNETLTSTANQFIEATADRILYVDMALDFEASSNIDGAVSNDAFYKFFRKDKSGDLISPDCVLHQTHWHFNSALNSKCKSFRDKYKISSNKVPYDYDKSYDNVIMNRQVNKFIESTRDLVGDEGNYLVSEFTDVIIDAVYKRVEKKKDLICAVNPDMMSPEALKKSWFCTKFNYNTGQWMEGKYYADDFSKLVLNGGTQLQFKEIQKEYINDFYSQAIESDNNIKLRDALVKYAENAPFTVKKTILEHFDKEQTPFRGIYSSIWLPLKLSTNLIAIGESRVEKLKYVIDAYFANFNSLSDKMDISEYKAITKDNDKEIQCIDPNDCIDDPSGSSWTGLSKYDDVLEELNSNRFDTKTNTIRSIKNEDEKKGLRGGISAFIKNGTSYMFNYIMGMNVSKCAEDYQFCKTRLETPVLNMNHVGKTSAEFGLGGIILTQLVVLIEKITQKKYVNRVVEAMSAVSLALFCFGLITKIYVILAFLYQYLKGTINIFIRFFVYMFATPIVLIKFLWESGDTEHELESVFFPSELKSMLLRTVVDPIALSVSLILAVTVMFIFIPLTFIMISSLATINLGTPTITGALIFSVNLIIFMVLIVYVAKKSAESIPYLFNKLVEFVDDKSGVQLDEYDGFGAEIIEKLKPNIVSLFGVSK